MLRMPIVATVYLALTALLHSSLARAEEPTETITFNAEESEFFERKIRPILIEHCYRCHSTAGEDVKGGLRVDDRRAMRSGGDSGAGVIPGDLDESLVLSAIRYESFEMPPDQKLPAHVIRDFELWIEKGAPDPREPKTIPVEAVKDSEIDWEQGREWWSFQPPKAHETPDVPDANHLRSKLDTFVQARLKEHELSPAPRAPSATLLRRLSFDLTGLPPEETWVRRQQLLNSPAGVSKYVEHLLASPAYGEHLAKMWLDLMRYADDQAHIVGNNTSLCFPNAYRYRDWVIEALNQDLAYDQFIRLQLAADLFTPDNPNDDVALGFIGLGPKYYRRNSPEVKADELEDRVDVLTRGLLGLTVACARCHDHKYDPIATTDYYALAGVFASIEMYNRPFDANGKADNKGQSKKPEDALHIVREKKIDDQFVAIRGDVKRRGPKVPRGFLAILAPRDSSADAPGQGQVTRVEFREGSGRLELAEQIVSRTNPLAARVIVNRIWDRLVGRPLVGTPSNFGSLGERPTHPLLLDDLSVRFMEHGWSLKWLCREIVNSHTYQQSSVPSPEQSQQDPENRWLSRMHRKRLSVEQWRDALLFASQGLNSSDTAEHTDPSDPKAQRRTVYCDVSRLKLNPMLALFDHPDPNAHSEKRAETTTAAQKLFLMNSPLMVEIANRIGNQVSDLPTPELIQETYLKLYSRTPSPEEVKFAQNYLEHPSSTPEQYIHALMMANEMLFLD